MTNAQPPGDEHDDPLRRAVAEYWDDIQRLADPRQLRQLTDLLAGTAEADPGAALAALADTLLDLLPPGHPVIRVLRSGTLYRSGPKTGHVQLGGVRDAASILRALGDAGTVPVTIYLTDEQHHAQVESAVEAFLAAHGLRIIDRDDPVIGSWFRRITARAKDGMRTPAGQDAALTVTHVLDSRLVLAQDAEVTARLLENLAPVIASLEAVRGAVIRAGALLVVKQEGDISVWQLTAAQQAQLDHRPQLAQSPHDIVAALSLISGSGPAEDDGAVLDLYVEEPVLGRDSRFLRETSVSFGRPRVAPMPDDELSPGLQRRPDLQRMRVTEVVLPFDLEEPPDGCRYTETTVRMVFDSNEVEALSLSQPPAEGAGGDRVGDSFLDTRGVGRQQLVWKLSARDDQFGLRPTGRQVQALVGTPIVPGRLTGTLDASIAFTRSAFGVDRRCRAEPRHPLRFALDVIDGTFETLPGEDCSPG